jgi:hypothetical protein
MLTPVQQLFKDITKEADRFQGGLDLIQQQFPWTQKFSVTEAQESTLNNLEKKLFMKGKNPGEEAVFSVMMD